MAGRGIYWEEQVQLWLLWHMWVTKPYESIKSWPGARLLPWAHDLPSSSFSLLLSHNCLCILSLSFFPIPFFSPRQTGSVFPTFAIVFQTGTTTLSLLIFIHLFSSEAIGCAALSRILDQIPRRTWIDPALVGASNCSSDLNMNLCPLMLVVVPSWPCHLGRF